MATFIVSSCLLVIGLLITSCEPTWGWQDSCHTESYCGSDEWQRWGNSCYRLTDRTQTPSESEKDCENLGGKMAAPRSAEENEFFVNLAGNIADLWIACTEDGELLCNGQSQNFSNWADEEPSNPNQHCVSLCGKLKSKFPKGKWLDVTCDATANRFLAVCIIRPSSQPRYCFPTDKNGQLVQESLVDHTIRELTTPTVVGCGRACVDEPQCCSFNIKRDGHKMLCQLNNATRCDAPEHFHENTQYFSLYSDDIRV